MATQVGFVYHPDYLLHDTGPHHPERPARLTAILTHLKRVKLDQYLLAVVPEPAAAAWVQLVHPQRYLDRLRAHVGQARPYSYLDADTVVGESSYRIALLSAGGALRAVDQVMRGEVLRAFAALRPPGHHASSDVAMGFCLLNNIAIAARYAQRQHGLKRVAIIDWDVHHGNGTQAIFADDPSVLYVSLHQYPFYPGTGARSERGAGAGEGLTVNIPMSAGSGDAEYLTAFQSIVAPAVAQFQPELLMISAGFDGHDQDPLAGMALTEEGFAGMTRHVVAWANQYCGGRIVSILEGGYHLRALPRSVEAHLRALKE